MLNFEWFWFFKLLPVNVLCSVLKFPPNSWTPCRILKAARPYLIAKRNLSNWKIHLLERQSRLEFDSITSRTTSGWGWRMKDGRRTDRQDKNCSGNGTVRSPEEARTAPYGTSAGRHARRAIVYTKGNRCNSSSQREGSGYT